MDVRKGLLYTKNHEWLDVNGLTATIGITDYAQHSLGEIVFVELPEVDDIVDKEDPFAVIESVKAASDIFMPITAKVLEVNEELEDSPEQLNDDPYGECIVKVEIIDDTELEELMTDEQYSVYLSELEE